VTPYRVPDQNGEQELEDLRSLRDDLLAWAEANGVLGWVCLCPNDGARFDVIMKAKGLREKWG
jgi:hypothetical protein